MPQRIQRRRTKGWRMPKNTVSVTRPGPFGNPYRSQAFANGAEGAVDAYRYMIENDADKLAAVKDQLRGKNLACFCAIGKPCHADVLLELANA